MTNAKQMNEKWFSWSWALGIKPIHPRGYLAITVWLAIAIPCGLASIGTWDVPIGVRIFSTVLFVVSNLAFFWTVFWKMR